MPASCATGYCPCLAAVCTPRHAEEQNGPCAVEFEAAERADARCGEQRDAYTTATYRPLFTHAAPAL